MCCIDSMKAASEAPGDFRPRNAKCLGAGVSRPGRLTRASRGEYGLGERIQKIEFTIVRVPLRPRPEKHMSRVQPNWGISELCAISGESGLTGWGETIVHYTWGRPDRDRAAELVSRDPFELLWDDGLGAGVQMALWDLAGQAAGVPC